MFDLHPKFKHSDLLMYKSYMDNIKNGKQQIEEPGLK